MSRDYAVVFFNSESGRRESVHSAFTLEEANDYAKGSSRPARVILRQWAEMITGVEQVAS